MPLQPKAEIKESMTEFFNVAARVFGLCGAVCCASAGAAGAPADSEGLSATKVVPRFSTAGFFPAPGSPRTVVNFNPGWRFFKADAVGAEKPDFDDSAWEAANLPHSLEILGENASGGRNYQGPAWYRWPPGKNFLSILRR